MGPHLLSLLQPPFLSHALGGAASFHNFHFHCISTDNFLPCKVRMGLSIWNLLCLNFTLWWGVWHRSRASSFSYLWHEENNSCPYTVGILRAKFLWQAEWSLADRNLSGKGRLSLIHQTGNLFQKVSDVKVHFQLVLAPSQCLAQSHKNKHDF